MANLYETDALAWSERQVALMRQLAEGTVLNEPLDWPNVIEEIQNVGLSELRACQTLIEEVLTHLLKLYASPESQDAKHWRDELQRLLNDSQRRLTQSIRQQLGLDDLYANALQRARAMKAKDSFPPLPDKCPFTLQDLINGDSNRLIKKLDSSVMTMQFRLTHLFALKVFLSRNARRFFRAVAFAVFLFVVVHSFFLPVYQDVIPFLFKKLGRLTLTATKELGKIGALDILLCIGLCAFTLRRWCMPVYATAEIFLGIFGGGIALFGLYKPEYLHPTFPTLGSTNSRSLQIIAFSSSIYVVVRGLDNWTSYLGWKPKERASVLTIYRG